MDVSGDDIGSRGGKDEGIEPPRATKEQETKP
jgi:hypothetical protein